MKRLEALGYRDAATDMSFGQIRFLLNLEDEREARNQKVRLYDMALAGRAAQASQEEWEGFRQALGV